jgi:branched-chain amino acid transport system substrate-binding protein
MGKKLAILGVFILVMAGMLLTACPAAGPTTEETVKIGFVAPYSGMGAQMGKLMRDSFQLAVDQQNAKGGILGGRMVEPLYYDDQMDPNQAAIVVRKAINVDHVVMMVGNYEPATAAVTRDLCRDNNIPFLSWADGIRNIVEGYKGMIQLAPDPASECGFVWNGCETRGLKTIALVFEEMEWGHELAALYHNRWDAPGSPVQIVEEVWHSMGKSDLITEYTKALSSNPDAVSLCEFSIPAIQAAVNATYQLGYEGVRFGSGPFADEQFVAGLPAAANGILATGYMLPYPGTESGDAFCKLLEDNVPDANITDVGAIAYDCANVAMLAIDQVGSSDFNLDEIGDAFYNLDYHLVTGDTQYSIDQYGKVVLKHRYNATIQDGKFVDITYWTYTEDYWQMDLDYGYTPSPGYTPHAFYP